MSLIENPPFVPPSSLSPSSLNTTPDQFSKKYKIDRYSQLLGQGESIFKWVCEAIDQWIIYPQPWTKVYCKKPIQSGVEFVTMVSHLGFYSLNGCRIIYTFDHHCDHRGVIRYGFAMGALTHHVECGEEVFVIEWSPHTDEVYYRIFVFSCPHHWLARIGYPLGRMMQRRFGRQSLQSVLQYVQQKQKRVSNF